MNLSYLSSLISGVNPDEERCRILNAARKKRIDVFLGQIPEKYSIAKISADIERLKSSKGSRLPLFVENFLTYAILVSIVVFILYWILFGFWQALLTGIILVILSFILDKNLGSLVDLSSDSEKLLKDFEGLVNELVAKQKNENAKKEK